MFPDRAGWDLPTVMMGKAVDYLALLVWSKTKGAQRGYGRPESVLPFNKPHRREGSKPKAAPLSVIKKRMRWLHRRRTPAGPQPIDKGQAIKNMLNTPDKKPSKGDPKRGS